MGKKSSIQKFFFLLLAINFSFFVYLNCMISSHNNLNQDSVDQEEDPIFTAIDKGDTKSVEKYIKKAPDVFKKQRFETGETPLFYAIRAGTAKTVECLIKEGASIFDSVKFSRCRYNAVNALIRAINLHKTYSGLSNLPQKEECWVKEEFPEIKKIFLLEIKKKIDGLLFSQPLNDDEIKEAFTYFEIITKTMDPVFANENMKYLHETRRLYCKMLENELYGIFSQENDE